MRRYANRDLGFSGATTNPDTRGMEIDRPWVLFDINHFNGIF